MNPSSRDIADMLANESSFGLTLATDLFIGREPDEPDNCVTIYDLEGAGPDLHLQKATSDFYNSAISMRIRNNSYLDGWQEAFDIMAYLHARGREVWNGTLYGIIKAMSEPQLVDWDESRRAIFVLNFDIKRKVSGGIGEMIIEQTFKIG